jgi:hypothetical protein
MSTTTKSPMLEAAEANADLGLYVFLVQERLKIPAEEHGFKDSSANPAEVESKWNRNPKANVGIDCGKSDLAVLDFDNDADVPEIINNLKSRKVKTARGLHVYLWGARPTTNMYDEAGKHIGEIKSIGGYVLGAGSIHPSGAIYTVIDDSPITDTPSGLIEKLTKKPASASSPATIIGDVIPYGQHDNELHRISGRLRHDGLEEEAIFNALVEVCEKRCENYGSDYLEMCRKHAHNICEKPVGSGLTLTIGGKDPETGIQVSEPPTFHADTIAEAAAKNKNIHITYSEDVFYGLAGRIIKKLQPETESHPVGNLLELLATFGNIVGPTAHYVIEDTRHYANINVVKVGKSSKSRKGTGKARIERIASQLDSSWFTSRNISGLGSGEAVIWDIRDPVMGPSKNKTTGEVTLVQIDAGVSDKRLYISEGEFSGVLAVAGRKDSILSTVIRNAWDHKALRNKVKGSPAVCLNPHVSISADITRDELLNLLSDSDRFNGFGNRFLWCFVDRQGLKPHGGEDIDWSKEIIELYAAVEFTKKQQRIFMDRNAREMWNRIYEELSEDVDVGVVGAVTGRGEAQVIRLALIFAMLDLSDHIRVEHLKAARALWQYCEDSARIIFGGVLKTHQRILDFIKGGPKTIREIQDTLFAKHKKVSEIEVDLNTLSAIGRVYTKTDEAGVERCYSVRS